MRRGLLERRICDLEQKRQKKADEVAQMDVELQLLREQLHDMEHPHVVRWLNKPTSL